MFSIAKEFKRQLQEAQIISDKYHEEGMNELEAEDLKCKSVGKASANSQVSRLLSAAMSNITKSLAEKIRGQCIEYKCPYYSISLGESD